MSKRVLKKEVAEELRATPIQRTLQQYLSQYLSDEREKYELNVASEFQRGRISVLKDLIDLTKE